MGRPGLRLIYILTQNPPPFSTPCVSPNTEVNSRKMSSHTLRNLCWMGESYIQGRLCRKQSNRKRNQDRERIWGMVGKAISISSRHMVETSFSDLTCTIRSNECCHVAYQSSYFVYSSFTNFKAKSSILSLYESYLILGYLPLFFKHALVESKIRQVQ